MNTRSIHVLVKRTGLLTTGIFLLIFYSATAFSQATQAESGLQQAIIRYDTIHHPVEGRFGMVVSQNSIATRVGQQVLASGGNAVDATVAVGFALAVTLPRAGNLGGSGFMLAHMAAEQKTIALDYRSAAPLTATVGQFSKPGGGMDMKRDTESNPCGHGSCEYTGLFICCKICQCIQFLHGDRRVGGAVKLKRRSILHRCVSPGQKLAQNIAPSLLRHGRSGWSDKSL